MFAMVSATKACRLTAPTGGAGTLVKKATLDFVPPCRTTSLTLVRLGANLRTPYSTRRRVIDLRCPRKESSRVIRRIDRGTRRRAGEEEGGRGRGREGGYPRSKNLRRAQSLRAAKWIKYWRADNIVIICPLVCRILRAPVLLLTAIGCCRKRSRKRDAPVLGRES